MKYGLAKASAFTQSIACSTSQTWLASIIRIAVGPDHLARDRQPAHVVLEVAADLHLDVAEARVDGFLAQSRRSFSSE